MLLNETPKIHLEKELLILHKQIEIELPVVVGVSVGTVCTVDGIVEVIVGEVGTVVVVE